MKRLAHLLSAFIGFFRIANLFIFFNCPMLQFFRSRKDDVECQFDRLSDLARFGGGVVAAGCFGQIKTSIQ